MTFWSSVRRFAGLWGLGVFIVLVLLLFRQVLLPFVLATLLAYILAPAVDRIARLKVRQRPIPRPAAVLGIYVVILSVLGLFLGVFLPRLSGDFARLFREAPAFFQRVEKVDAPRVSGWLDEHFPSDRFETETAGPRPERKIVVRQTSAGQYDISLEGLEIEVEPQGKGHYRVGPLSGGPAGGRFDDLFAQLARASQTEAMDVLRIGQRFIAAVIHDVAMTILILMVAAFLLVDLDRVRRFLRGLIPARHRDDWERLAAEMDRGLAGVIRGQFLICLVNGLLTWVGLALLHVKYPILLGLLAATMSLIPVFGSILSSIPIVAVALSVGGFNFGRGLGALAWIVGIHLLEANFLNPKIIGKAAKIHPVLVIFALLAGERTGGLIGALIAVPVASVIQTLFLFFQRQRDGAGAAAEAPAEVEALPGSEAGE